MPDFGTEEYKEKIEAENNVPVQDVPIFYYGTFGFYRMYISSLTESAENKILAMMNDVNNCHCTDLITSDNWIKFCEYFNECVQEYGEVTQDIHYFRLKLNRTPETLDEMIKLINSTNNINDKWIMCSPYKGRYHMFGDNGAYNVKFISSNNTDNIYEAVYDINGNLITENDNYGKNMGTYNYASSSKQSAKHIEFDVRTYNKWKNTELDYEYKNDKEKADNNVTKDNHPAMKNDYSKVDELAKSHFEWVCDAISINYYDLVEYNYSDKCFK